MFTYIEGSIERPQEKRTAMEVCVKSQSSHADGVAHCNGSPGSGMAGIETHARPTLSKR